MGAGDEAYAARTHQPAKRNAMMIAAHIVWGGTLGAIFAAPSFKRVAAPTKQPS